MSQDVKSRNNANLSDRDIVPRPIWKSTNRKVHSSYRQEASCRMMLDDIQAPITSKIPGFFEEHPPRHRKHILLGLLPRQAAVRARQS